MRTMVGHNDSVDYAMVLLGGRIFSWGDDHTFRLWNPDGTPLKVLEAHTGYALGLLVGHQHCVSGALELRDGRILSWSLDWTLRLWDADGLSSDVLEGHSDQVHEALELKDGLIFSWSYDKTLRLWGWHKTHK